MIRLNPDAVDEEILAAVEAWTELLAAGRFDDAFAQTLHRQDVGWTPELMRTVIANYGSVVPYEDGRTFHVTSPAHLPRDHGFFFGVERYDDDPNRPQEYVGAAMYTLPLNGEWSDLTALFDLVLVDGLLHLSLDDLHVL